VHDRHDLTDAEWDSFGAAAAVPDAGRGRVLAGSPAGDQQSVLADPDRGAVAGPAEVLRELEDRLLPASSLVRRWHARRPADSGNRRAL